MLKYTIKPNRVTGSPVNGEFFNALFQREGVSAKWILPRGSDVPMNA